jgi:protein TonB
MQVKKKKTANLERKRFRFFQVGLILSVSLSLAAFEWVTPEITRKKTVATEKLPDEVIFVPVIPEPEKEPEKLEPQTNRQIIDLSNVEIVETEKEVIEDPNLVPVDNPIDEVIKPVDGNGDGPTVVDVDPNIPIDWKDVDEMPKFDYPSFLQKHLSYPRISIETGNQGTVYVTFTVTKEGEIKNISVKHTTGDTDELMKKEAMRVVSKMPTWAPGKMHGLPVAVTMVLPIKFVLQ